MKNKIKNATHVCGVLCSLALFIGGVLLIPTGTSSKTAADDTETTIVALAPDVATSTSTSATTESTQITKITTTSTSTATSIKITTEVEKELATTIVIIEEKEEFVFEEEQILEDDIKDISYEEKEEEEIIEYFVYKPETYYVHKNTCPWVEYGIVEVIEDTYGIEARKCGDCNPDIEIINEYVPPAEESAGISDYDRQLLAEITWHEAGSSWISQYDKAHIVSGVMNRVNDSRFPDTIYGVLTQPYQFSGYWPGCCTPSSECYDAVDYYFSHTGEFDNCNSWYGNGTYNTFYYQ